MDSIAASAAGRGVHLHVDLHAAQLHLAADPGLGRRAEDLRERAVHDPLAAGVDVAQCERLPRARLAVTHHAAVDALEHAADHARLAARRRVHLVLVRLRRQRPVEDKLPRPAAAASGAARPRACRRAARRARAVASTAAVDEPQRAALAQDGGPAVLPLLGHLGVAHRRPHAHRDEHARLALLLALFLCRAAARRRRRLVGRLRAPRRAALAAVAAPLGLGAVEAAPRARRHRRPRALGPRGRSLRGRRRLRRRAPAHLRRRRRCRGRFAARRGGRRAVAAG